MGGKTAAELEGDCPPDTISPAAAAGVWKRRTYPLTNADVGKNNFIWASKKCEEVGGWLPSASELIGRRPNT